MSKARELYVRKMCRTYNFKGVQYNFLGIIPCIKKDM